MLCFITFINSRMLLNQIATNTVLSCSFYSMTIKLVFFEERAWLPQACRWKIKTHNKWLHCNRGERTMNWKKQNPWQNEIGLNYNPIHTAFSRWDYLADTLLRHLYWRYRGRMGVQFHSASNPLAVTVTKPQPTQGDICVKGQVKHGTGVCRPDSVHSLTTK